MTAASPKPRENLNSQNWEDRLCIEYFHLSERIQNHIIALNMFPSAIHEDARDLMLRELDLMTRYQRMLFRRICFYGIPLFDME